MAEQLEPCPFCGGSATLQSDLRDAIWWVACDRCEAQGPWVRTEAVAVAGWDRRAADPVRADLLVACEALIGRIEAIDDPRNGWPEVAAAMAVIARARGAEREGGGRDG